MIRLLRWLDPASKAELVLLSSRDYLRLWKAWDLPDPSSVGLP